MRRRRVLKIMLLDDILLIKIMIWVWRLIAVCSSVWYKFYVANERSVIESTTKNYECVCPIIDVCQVYADE